MSTVLHRLVSWAEEAPDAPAQRFKKAKSWHTITSRDLADRIFALARFFEARGIDSSSVGAILSYNCPEWVQVELALTLVGGKSAGLYPNSTPKDIAYILAQTEARVLAVQNGDYFKKIRGADGAPSLPASVSLVLSFHHEKQFYPGAVFFGDAIEEGMNLLRAEYGGKKHGFMTEMRKRYLDRLDPKAGALLIYTSGTTGNPKGVVLSHDNLAFAGDLVIRHARLPFARGTMFSFLPLCHIAEKLQNMGVGITQRYLVSYATRFENVSSELVEVQPTILLCVPRLWEKMMEGVMSKVQSGGQSPKARLARWALSVGARVAEARYAGRAPNPIDSLQWIAAQKLVVDKIKHALGLSQAELLGSGAAALPGHVVKWFRSLGLEILEDYGQSESAGVISMTEPGVESAGSVGRPFDGTEFKIAEDGEILTRGRHVFVEYYKDPAATRATLDAQGWLMTGDLGVIDDRGLLCIRGRKKEILKTSGGKMIAPGPLEARLKELCPIISQVCVVGDNRKYLSALVTLVESAPRGSDADKQVRAALDRLNSQLASYEQIKRFVVLERDFSVEQEEMTPTLKVKRGVIEKRYGSQIDSMYG